MNSRYNAEVEVGLILDKQNKYYFVHIMDSGYDVGVNVELIRDRQNKCTCQYCW